MSTFDPAAVVAAVQSVLSAASAPVALHEPSFRGREWEYVRECIDTGWVSSAGKFVDRFERDLAELTGVRRAVAVVNGTAALHVCLLLVGVERGDEVLVPSLTFVATANAVSYCGATPHFVDSCPGTLGMDPRKLAAYLSEMAEVRSGTCFNRRTGARIRAVVPMHAFGHPVDLDPLTALCDAYGLALVEDAAESLGSSYKGRPTGSFGRVSALSFNGNKIVTTGGGGAILTNDEALGARAKHLTTTARVPHQWSFVHDQVGYNYRLPNINAALGCAQLEQLSSWVEQKRLLAQRYSAALKGVSGVRFFTEPPLGRSNYWLNALFVEEGSVDGRDLLLKKLNDAGVQARPVWTLMHRLPMYCECPRMTDLSVAEQIERSLVNIPSSPFLVDGNA